MRRITSFLIGTFLGGLTGAALGLLFAPDSGPKLQKALRQQVENFTSEIRSAAEARRLELQRELDRLRSDSQ